MIKKSFQKKSETFWMNIFRTQHEKKDLESIISNMAIFINLTRKSRRMLLNIVHHRAFNNGEFIFYQGDPGIGFYIIREGTVRIIQTDEYGEEKVMTEFGRGDFFGDLALFEDEIRSASAIAVSDVKLGVIFKPDLDEFINRYPDKGVIIQRGISQIIVSRLRQLNTDYNELYKQFVKLSREIDHGDDKKNTGTD